MTTKIKCDECGKNKPSRNVLKYKNKFKCFTCRQREKGMEIMRKMPFPQVNLSEALEKEYEIKGTLQKPNTLVCYIYVPKILFGKKVKLVLNEPDMSDIVGVNHPAELGQI